MNHWSQLTLTRRVVTLGKEAIDAKEEEARLSQEIEKLRHQASEAASPEISWVWLDVKEGSAL